MRGRQPHHLSVASGPARKVPAPRPRASCRPGCRPRPPALSYRTQWRRTLRPSAVGPAHLADASPHLAADAPNICYAVPEGTRVSASEPRISDMAHRRQGPVAFDEVAVPRAASGLTRAGQSRAPSARGSLGTLCPRLPRLLTSLRGFHPGWPGRSFMAEAKEVRGVGWRDPVARPGACGGGRRASVPA